MKNEALKTRITILEDCLDKLYCRRESEDDGNNKCDYDCATCQYNYHNGLYDSSDCQKIVAIKAWIAELETATK